eukprot:973112-Pleurochrysis_carterae.AAC.6
MVGTRHEFLGVRLQSVGKNGEVCIELLRDLTETIEHERSDQRGEDAAYWVGDVEKLRRGARTYTAGKCG